MSPGFECPSCGAQYSFDQVSPGAVFSCGVCSAKVTAPDAPAREVVAPIAAQPPSPAPVPAPPAAAGRGGRGTVRRAARAGSGGAAVRQTKAAARPAAGRGAKGSASAAGSKKGLTLLFAGMGLAVAVAAILVVSFSGGDEGEGGGGSAKPVAPQITSQELFEEANAAIAKTAIQGTAEDRWKTVEAYMAKAEELSAVGDTTHRGAATLLRQEADKVRQDILAKHPDFLPLREERGEEKVDFAEFAALQNVAWLDEVQKFKASELQARIAKRADRNGGWLEKRDLQPLTAFLEEVEPLRTKHAELTSTDWYKKTEEMEADILKTAEERFAGLLPEMRERWKGFEKYVVQPYVVWVQRDEGWDEKTVAQSQLDRLKKLEGIISREFADMDLPTIEGPVPMLLFRSAQWYQAYAQSPGAAAHYEPINNRLVLPDSTPFSTFFHEGTHQLMANWIAAKTGRSAVAMLQGSFWFHEGIAEWYGGATVVYDGGKPTYEVGRIQSGRLQTIKESRTRDRRDKLYSIEELLPVLYTDRGEIGQEGRTLMVYAQAWFLIYFLNNYNEAADGSTDPTKPGIYSARWRNYIRKELTGETGKAVFMEALGIDEDELAKMERNYWRYFDWVRKKEQLKAITKGVVVPWSEQVNRRGRKVGAKEDDLLPEFDPEIAPPSLSK